FDFGSGAARQPRRGDEPASGARRQDHRHPSPATADTGHGVQRRISPRLRRNPRSDLQQERRRSQMNNNERIWGLPAWVLPTIAMIVLILLWEAIVKGFSVPLYIIPAPSDIYKASVHSSGSLLF